MNEYEADQMWAVWEQQMHIAEVLTERLGIRVELDPDTRQYVISRGAIRRYLDGQPGEQSADTIHNPQTAHYEATL